MLKKEYHRSHRIAITMCRASGSMLSMLEWLCAHLMEAEISDRLAREKANVQYSRSATVRIPATAAGYPNGYDVSHGSESASGWLYPVLCNRTQAQ